MGNILEDLEERALPFIQYDLKFEVELESEMVNCGLLWSA